MPERDRNERGRTLRVTELFHSIQGESTQAGEPCVFVRLTGCPLRCRWCDTAYAFQGGTRRSLESLLAEIAGYGCRMVEVTGGEPLAQDETPELLARLCDAGYQVLLETSGAVDIRGVDRRVTVIMDLKCPDSGESDRNLFENLSRLKTTDEIKFVVASRGDFDWAIAQIRDRNLAETGCALLFAPVWGEVEPRELAEWILKERTEARIRLQIQVHKVLYGPDSRGV